MCVLHSLVLACSECLDKLIHLAASCTTPVVYHCVGSNFRHSVIYETR